MLTPQMIQQANAITGKNVSLTPGAPPSRAQQILDIAAKAKPVAAPTPTNPIADQFHQGIDQVKEAGHEIFSGHENPVQAVESGLKAESGIATAVTSPLAPVMKPVSNVINWLGEKIGGTQAAQDFVKQHPDAAATLERLATDASNAGNVAGTITGAEGVAKGIPKAVDATKSAVEAIKTTPEEAAATQASVNAGKVQTIADEWKQPTVPGKAANPASFNKASDVLTNNPEVPKFLAEQKITPAANIENGRYATEDTAAALRDTAGKMSSETLRPSLQMADYSTPKTPISEIKVPEKLIQAQGKGVTPDDVEKINTIIASKLDALTRKYPNGMSLENLHDNKITYAQNGKFSPVGDSGVDNGAIANRAISSVLGNLLEKKAPESVPVKEFNSYLSKYYKAADYLDALDTKKAPVSLGQYVAHRAAQVAGAVIGHGVGGGILGGVGGYMLGGALEHALENMSTHMRSSFLSNLEITNPKAFTAVQEYLKAQNTGANGVLRLPAAGPQTPIPLGGDSVTPTPSVAPFAEKTKLPTYNPKTGRAQRTYTSAPK